MDNFKFCPNCGKNINGNDKFCRECGFDIDEYKKSFNDKIDIENNTTKENIENTDKFEKIVEEPIINRNEYFEQQIYNNSKGKRNKRNSNIIVCFLIFILIVSVVIVIALNMRNNGNKNDIVISESTEKNSEDYENSDMITDTELTRASTYLSKPGIKLTALVNYPDSIYSAIVSRVSGVIVSSKNIRVSEVEIDIEYGEEYGFVFHYLERSDGTYYIMDDYPFEIYPLLKNNLFVGKSWDYSNEFGEITWTVEDIGINLDLGFENFENCILIREYNKSLGYNSISYYAPNVGLVYVVAPNGTEYYKVTNMENIDLGKAAEIIKQWGTNYLNIDEEYQY